MTDSKSLSHNLKEIKQLFMKNGKILSTSPLYFSPKHSHSMARREYRKMSFPLSAVKCVLVYLAVCIIFLAWFLVSCSGTEETLLHELAHELAEEGIIEPGESASPSSSEQELGTSQPRSTPVAPPTPLADPAPAPVDTPPAPVDTPPAPVDTPPAFDTVVFIEQYPEYAEEGGTFLVYLGFEGTHPELGNCNIRLWDTAEPDPVHKEFITNGQYVRIEWRTDNDGVVTPNRSVDVTILDCSFPDLDELGESYQIDTTRRYANVSILEDGQAAPGTDTQTYTANLVNVRPIRWRTPEGWNDDYFYDTELWVDIEIDGVPPHQISLDIDYFVLQHDRPEDDVPTDGPFKWLYQYIDGEGYIDGTGWLYDNGSNRIGLDQNDRHYRPEKGTYSWAPWLDYEDWDYTRTYKVVLNEFSKSTYFDFDCQCYKQPSGGKYVVGENNTMIVTIQGDAQ